MTNQCLPDPDELLPMSRVAELLGVDGSRLRRRVQSGLVDAQRVGSMYVTTLRRVVEGEKRGSRGPSATPIPDRIRALVDDKAVS